MNYGYKHTRGFIVFILIFVIGCLTAAYAQTSPNTPSGYSIDSQTGNLIPNSALTSITDWTSTTGSPTWTANPNPLGSFDPVDGYTFSNVRESLGLNPSISLSSFNHGYLNSSAVFVTGFSYGLTYRFPCANNIGTNCDGTSQTAAPANPIQDNLRVEVGYYPSTGQATFYTHQLGLKNMNDGYPAYNPTWQQLNQTVTFAGAKPLAQAGSVNFEIIGQDAGGWACLGSECYGPQVKNAYIRANYSVDPCILNPAFNPNCPGFNTVIQAWQSPTYWHSYNIATTLPHIGGGVQLHGFDYGFNWSNYGSCYNTFMFWCTDWRTDGGGNMNFRVSDKNNNTLYYDQQYRQGNNQWGSYSNRFLFTETRNSLDMGYVQWWADGVWNNFAVAGWTRPIWTPDPCYFNGLYSPNCTNFRETLTQVLADIKAQQERVAALNTSSTTNTSFGSITTTIADANSTSPSVTVTTNVDTTQNSTPSRSSDSASNTNLALNLIGRNQQRESSIAMQASQSAVTNAALVSNASLQQATSVAQTAAQQSQETSDQSQAVQITKNDVGPSVGFQAMSQQARNDTVNQSTNQPANTSVVTQTQQQSVQSANTEQDMSSQNMMSTSTIAIVRFDAMNESSQTVAIQPMIPALLPPTPAQSQAQNESVQTASIYTPVQVQNNDNKIGDVHIQEPVMARSEVQVAIVQPPGQTIDTTPTLSLMTAITTTPPVTNVELPTITANFVSDKTNPINDIVENKQPAQEQDRQQTRTETVKSNVQDNDAASGGVSIATMSVIPVGFTAYTIALADAAFYAPKEIYRNQRTVDNARVLRQLASDRLHQQMVDQQYNRQ
jgi:hypothetical protein